jgi:hypothetical protein
LWRRKLAVDTRYSSLVYILSPFMYMAGPLPWAAFSRSARSARTLWNASTRKCAAYEEDPAKLYLLEETVLPVDAVVSVYGTWSAERGGIVADNSDNSGRIQSLETSSKYVHGP